MAWNGQRWTHGGDGYYSQPHSSQRQWSRPPPQQRVADSAWVCGLCAKNNTSKKACAQCRASRDFADASAGRPATPTPPTASPRAGTNLVNSQLQQALDLLAPAMGAPRGTAYVSASCATPVGAVTPAGSAPATPASKAELQSRIRSLESALSQLPVDGTCADIHGRISADIDAAKRLITEMKPIGARLDACRAALDRSRARKESAELAVMAAQAALASADNEAAHLMREVASLELELKSQPQDCPASPAPPDSVTQLRDGMAKVLDEMAHGIVPPDIIGAMHQRLAEVFNDVTILSQSCTAAAAASQANHAVAAPSVYEMLRAASNHGQQKNAAPAPPPVPHGDQAMEGQPADVASIHRVPSGDSERWENEM